MKPPSSVPEMGSPSTTAFWSRAFPTRRGRTCWPRQATDPGIGQPTSPRPPGRGRRRRSPRRPPIGRDPGESRLPGILPGPTFQNGLPVRTAPWGHPWGTGSQDRPASGSGRRPGDRPAGPRDPRTPGQAEPGQRRPLDHRGAGRRRRRPSPKGSPAARRRRSGSARTPARGPVGTTPTTSPRRSTASVRGVASRTSRLPRTRSSLRTVPAEAARSSRPDRGPGSR